jgi:peptidoglycan hydrolase CwlO-like protein
MRLFFLRGILRKILGVAQEILVLTRENRGIAQATLKEIFAMSQTLDNLNAAVDATVVRLGELSTEVADLKAQVATYVDLAAQTAVLEAAAVADTAAEQAAADKLTAAVVANPV